MEAEAGGSGASAPPPAPLGRPSGTGAAEQQGEETEGLLGGGPTAAAAAPPAPVAQPGPERERGGGARAGGAAAWARAFALALSLAMAFAAGRLTAPGAALGSSTAAGQGGSAPDRPTAASTAGLLETRPRGTLVKEKGAAALGGKPSSTPAFAPANATKSTKSALASGATAKPKTPVARPPPLKRDVRLEECAAIWDTHGSWQDVPWKPGLVECPYFSKKAFFRIDFRCKGWKPDYHTLRKWTVPGCKVPLATHVLLKRSLLFIGDSLSRQSFDSFSCQIWEELGEDAASLMVHRPYIESETSTYWHGCNEVPTLQLRWCYAEGGTSRLPNKGGKTRNYAYRSSASILKLLIADGLVDASYTVVLNQGQWPETMLRSRGSWDNFTDELAAVKESVLSLGALLLWRETAPNTHAKSVDSFYCWNKKLCPELVDIPGAPKACAPVRHPDRPKHFVLTNAGVMMADVPLLRIYNLTISQWDVRTSDCMHVCLPSGIIEAWNNLILLHIAWRR